MEEREQQMEKCVDELTSQSMEYFRGKKLLFENNSEYIQCIRHPTESNTFISVQKVDSRTNSGETEDGPEALHLRIPPDKGDKNELFNQ